MAYNTHTTVCGLYESRRSVLFSVVAMIVPGAPRIAMSFFPASDKLAQSHRMARTPFHVASAALLHTDRASDPKVLCGVKKPGQRDERVLADRSEPEAARVSEHGWAVAFDVMAETQRAGRTGPGCPKGLAAVVAAPGANVLAGPNQKVEAVQDRPLSLEQTPPATRFGLCEWRPQLSLLADFVRSSAHPRPQCERPAGVWDSRPSPLLHVVRPSTLRLWRDVEGRWA